LVSSFVALVWKTQFLMKEPRGTIHADNSADGRTDQGRHRVVKRIATVLFALSFAALPARADGIKATSGTLGVAALSAVLCTFTVLYAEEGEDSPDEDFDRKGFFIGVGGNFAGENFSARPVGDIADIFSNQPGRGIPILPGPESSSNSDDSWSVKGGGGYRCHSRFSVGATFEYFGGFDTKWTGVMGTGADDIDMLAVTTDIKGYLMTGRYQPYLLAGGGIMHAKTEVTNPTGIGTTTVNPDPPSDDIPNIPNITTVFQSRDYTDFVFRLGGGIDVYATDNVVVNIGASFLLPLGEVSGLRLYTVGGGLEYRF
jgi:opacity protein-like surface antigen